MTLQETADTYLLNARMHILVPDSLKSVMRVRPMQLSNNIWFYTSSSQTLLSLISKTDFVFCLLKFSQSGITSTPI